MSSKNNLYALNHDVGRHHHNHPKLRKAQRFKTLVPAYKWKWRVSSEWTYINYLSYVCQFESVKYTNDPWYREKESTDIVFQTTANLMRTIIISITDGIRAESKISKKIHVNVSPRIFVRLFSRLEDEDMLSKAR